jgi:hypothetical protein
MKGPEWRVAVLQLQILAQRLGALPALACLLCTMGLAGWLAASTTQGDEAVQLTEQVAEAQRLLRVAPSHGVPWDAPQQALQAFEQALGDPLGAEAALRQIFDAAARAGLALEQGEYRWQVDRATGSDRYQVRLSTKGRYAAVRVFCEQALRAVPFAALEELNLRREAIDEEAVSVSLQFSLHVHGTTADPVSMRSAP